MKKFITNWQMAMILYCIVSEYNVINLPKRVAESAGTGGWITLIIATILFVVITYVITYLQYVYEGKTLYEYSQQLIGKFFTYIIIASYIIYFFTYISMIIRKSCEAINLTILINTPLVYICLLVYIVVYYALIKGLSVIAKLCEMYGVISIINVILISTILLTQGQLVNIKPLFVTNDITIYLKSIFNMVLPLLGVEIMMSIPISRSANKNIFKYTMGSMVFMGILFIYLVEAAFSVGGINLLINSESALFSIARGIDVPFLEFFRKPDGIYIIVWTLNVVCAASMWGYGTVTFINKIFKSIKYKYIVVTTVIMSFIVSQLPKTTKQVEMIMDISSYFGTVLIFVIPSILFLITKVKKYDKNLS